MRYYTYIDIDHFEVIQQKTLEFMKTIDVPSLGFFWLNWHNFKKYCPEAFTCAMKFGVVTTGAALYITSRDRDSKVHVDHKPTPGYNSCRINIPIMNCNGSRTEYYRINDANLTPVIQKVGTAGLPYFEDLSGTAELIDSVEINKPTLIRIDQPHRVKTNEAHVPRVCLTLKTSKDLATLLDY